MYIIVDEFGELYQTDLVTQSERDASDDGILEIVNATDMTSYFRGEWIELMPWEG